jgi:MerR family transcriptional regulator/heat shock protein HspR
MRIKPPSTANGYTISGAAEQLQLSVHTLRKYEFHGLMLPAHSIGNQRRYFADDLERARCIHEAVNKQRISIEGIKRMLSLIPCWVMVACSLDDRARCKAYTDAAGPCWSLQHKNNVCAFRECRACEVYREATTCHSLKQLLRSRLSSPSTGHEHP